MSIDIVDDLEAAEDRIGVLQHLVDEVAAFARTNPWTGLADGPKDLLAALRVAAGQRWCRPTCEDGCVDDTCGCQAHPDQDPPHRDGG